MISLVLYPLLFEEQRQRLQENNVVSFRRVAFRKHRLRFCNSFHADDTQDAVFYIMSVWQQLAMRPTDILVITGNA